MVSIKHVLRLLSDGQFHSGEEIGAVLGVSRAAVWKTMKRLSDMQIDLHAVTGRGYQIPHGLELLDHETILAHMDPLARARLTQLDIFDSVTSTNQYLLDAAEKESGRVCLAECQTAGRGRRSRSWSSPFGVNIYLSLIWQFPGGAADLNGLSLSVGVMIARALEAYGLHGIGLKWPNDVFYRKQKLAGILLEIVGNIEGPCQVVIGIGLNVSMTQLTSTAVDQSWTDVQSIIAKKPARNHLASLLLNQLLTGLPLFQEKGFLLFSDDWQQLDVLAGQRVTLQTLTEKVEGTAVGIDRDSGHLVVNSQGTPRRFNSGEVSVRWLE